GRRGAAFRDASVKDPTRRFAIRREYDRCGMPTASSAQLARVIPFPDELGEGMWRETRSFPVMVVGGPVVALLVVGAIGVRSVALHPLLGVAAILAVWLLMRARERAMIETYTVTERFVAVEQ